MTIERNPWLPVSPIDTTATRRLFCLPYAGGGTAIYRPWIAAVPPHVQVCPVQLPGRESRMAERPFKSMETLVPALVDALRTHFDRPFAFFGHSMGALVAFELARALRRHGLPFPRQLFLSAHRAPQLPDRRPPLHQLDEQAFRDELRRLDGTPPEVLEHDELMELLTPTLRADFQLCETYTFVAEAPLDIPFAVYGGTEDSSVDRAELDAWREHTSAPISVRMFEGHHLYLQQARTEVLQAIVVDRLSSSAQKEPT